jgi:hypothetical protein
MKTLATDLALARHIITFNQDDPATHGPWTLPQSSAMLRASLVTPPWPKALAPKPQPIKTPKSGSPLPQADVLVVTWTAAEASALSDVLTPGFTCHDDWYPYTHGYATLKQQITNPEAPALEAKRLGSYFLTTIGKQTVLTFKSELHLSQDGPHLPIRALWKQIITECQAKLVITTGTAGGIGADIELGDVVLTRSVRFDCMRTFKNSPFAQSKYISGMKLPLGKIAFANAKLIAANAAKLPPALEKRIPQIVPDTKLPVKSYPWVVTTDFFAFDTSTNTYGLAKLGSAVEMGDAVLALVVEEDLAVKPDWLVIRNASDPQIDGTLPVKDQRTTAAQIYERYGYWTTVNSAIATWAAIAEW